MSTQKKLIFINTKPKANVKKDGSIFYTVLVGLSKNVISEHTALPVDKITMNVFENQLDKFAMYFDACKKVNGKLALSCDDIVLTEPKQNTYLNAAGENIVEMQASCWADGPSELIIVKSSVSVSPELEALMNELNDNEDDDLFGEG